jgi:hypothetical protein
MGRKITNKKLQKPLIGRGETVLSVFNRFANKITESHKKKIEKKGDTKQRVMEAKKNNRLLKMSHKKNKFALLDDGPLQGLTHRGKNINEINEFNDVNFDSDVDD